MIAEQTLVQAGEIVRRLATIQEVSKVEPIPGADAIEKIAVLGWWVVVKKGEFAVGDKVVYCEIDSLLPVQPEYEFLRKSCYRPAVVASNGTIEQPEGFRIKTVKLRGQVSQGICFPLTFDGCDIGDDVTERMGIVKYERRIPSWMTGKAKGHFPGFIPKTDEPRVQNMYRELAGRKGELFQITEKLDGSSFTAFVKNGEWGVCSRTIHLDEADESSAFVALAKRLDLRKKMLKLREILPYDFAIQGEMIGPGIQGNKYKLTAIDLYVFSVFNIDKQEYSSTPDREAAMLGVKQVPLLGTITLPDDSDDLVKLSIGQSVINKDVRREGIVVRSTTGERLSFKVINPEFLLKYDE